MKLCKITLYLSLMCRKILLFFQEYLLADKNMSIAPVAFSLMASFMSAITLLGVSSENYTYGFQFIVINISYGLFTPVAAYLYLPVFFRLQATSAYEVFNLTKQGDFYVNKIFLVFRKAFWQRFSISRISCLFSTNASVHGNRSIRTRFSSWSFNRNKQGGCNFICW